MRKGLVIADDLTGAAEIAGIAHRFGLTARVFRDYAHDVPAQINIIDSDTRSLGPQAAREKLRDRLAVIFLRDFDLIFKKTDSALRGPIAAEIETVMMRTGKSTTLLVPNNPSRGRTISGGIYRIDGIPLHQTAFANDPEWPATTSDVARLTGISPNSPVTIPDSSTAADIESLAAAVSQGIHALPAGGADFFEAILRQRGLIPKSATPSPLSVPAFFVCGTTAPSAAELAERASAVGIRVCSIFENSADIADALRRSGCVLININRPIDPSPQAAKDLQMRMADLVAELLKVHPVAGLFVDGGATASAICEKMNWRAFDVLREISPGIVTLRIAGSDASQLTIKPGSYRWPEEVLEHRFSAN
jgi:D-threonate/D-erythronate kinase